MSTIELRALADVSARVRAGRAERPARTRFPKRPPSVVRHLARHEEITVAGPVLIESARAEHQGPGRDRADQERETSAGDRGPVVVARGRHRLRCWHAAFHASAAA